MKVLSLFCFLLVQPNTCGSKAQELFSKEISTVTIQKWIAGVEGGGAGIIFNMYIKNALPNNITLTKVQCRKYEALLNKVSPVHYQANLITLTSGRNPEPVKELNSSLKDNQAKIFYTKDNKEYTYVIETVKEIEFIPYPSANPKKGKVNE
jgi:hypothetical protein